MPDSGKSGASIAGEAAGSGTAPLWAQRLHAQQRRRAQWLVLAQAIREGDRPAGQSNPDLKEPS